MANDAFFSFFIEIKPVVDKQAFFVFTEETKKALKKASKDSENDDKKLWDARKKKT